MKWIEHPRDTGFENGLAYRESKRGGTGSFNEPEGVMICVCSTNCSGQCEGVASPPNGNHSEGNEQGTRNPSPYAVL